ncbi:MAG: hypothetical protein QY323_01420 [Patescibacteria group bacterium]|nr:MAG: hypothetical protein QY323_01420 [Patescibacteria group bacterium]
MRIGITAVSLIATVFLAFSAGCSLETTSAPIPEPTLADDVITASQSPDGALEAVWTKNHEVLLVDPNGSVLQKIGVHGAAPIFSHDGRFVAYEKLADGSADGAEQSLFEFALGIAVHDLQTGREYLVTNGGSDDFAPVGFSRDLSMLYFNSTRPYDDSSGNRVASLWVVNLKTGETKRLTNVDEEAVRNGRMIPTISPTTALWSSDRVTVFTSYGHETGVWKFALTDSSASATRIAEGDAPQWVVPDKSISVRTLVDGKDVRHTINVR